MITFSTVISRAKTSNNNTYGKNLQLVKVYVYTRPFPYNDVDRIEVFDSDDNQIELKELNRFEQENLIDEARRTVYLKTLNKKVRRKK